MSKEFHQELLELNGEEITVDLENQIVKTDQSEYQFDIDPFAKFCLINGTNEFDFLVNKTDEIEAYELEYSK